MVYLNIYINLNIILKVGSKMKDNTLYFHLKSDENNRLFSAQQILEQINEQRNEWIENHKYIKPKYVAIDKEIYEFLYDQLVNKSKIKVWFDRNIEDNSKTILGMIVKEVKYEII